MKSKLIKILFIAAVGLLLMKSGVNAAIYLWPKTELDATGNSAAIELIQLTNEYRRNLGLRELIVNPRLTQAAVNKAKDLLAKQYFNHTSPTGKKFSDWVKEVNYSYFYVGENLAIDFANPQEVFDAWIKSPKHKENIERPEFQEIGIADLKGLFDSRETDVVVQLFGSRVLGENEKSTSSNSALINNYFGTANAGSSAYDYFGWIDQQLNYILFFIIFVLVITIIIRKIRRKKLPASNALRSNAGRPLQSAAASLSNKSIIRVSAKKQAPPLVSLYTKRTLTAYENSQTSKKTLPPDIRKPAKTKSPKPKPLN